MTNEYFVSLFEYDKWANLKIAEAFEHANNLPPKCKVLYHHIGAVLDRWYRRVTNGEELFTNLFEETDPGSNTKLMITAEERWIEYLKSGVDINSIVNYKNTKGDEFTNSLQDILVHIMTHNHYHRGQINQLLREAGLEPAVIDYILYKRK